MKPADLRGMSDEQIDTTLRELERSLFQMRFQLSTDRLETPTEIRKARKDIARILTIQRERQLGLTPGAKPGTKAETKRG